MVIRKLFRYESSHIVRNCSSEKCKYSIHGHSYELEIFLTATRLDNGQMIYDFDLLKGFLKGFIDSFDHSMIFWNKDDPKYQDFIMKNSARWISLPVSPSAEMLAYMFLKATDFILQKTIFANGESDVTVKSVRLHETKTGYAEAERTDLINPNFPKCQLKDIKFSKAIQKTWNTSSDWEDLLNGKNLINHPTKIQVKN